MSEETSQPAEVKPVRKFGFWSLVAWAMSILSFMAGMGLLVSAPLSGVLDILAGAIILPPFWTWVRKRWNFELSGFLKAVAFVILVSVSPLVMGNAARKSVNTNETPQPTAEAKVQREYPTATPKPTPTPKVMPKIGDVVVDGDLTFTVTSTSTAKSLGSQYFKKEAQGEFFIVTLKVANQGKETKTIDSSMIIITDSQGRKFDRSIDGQTAKGMSQGKVDMFLQQVQPGLSITGDVVFDIPKDDTGLKLVVKGKLFSSGKEIDLGR